MSGRDGKGRDDRRRRRDHVEDGGRRGEGRGKETVQTPIVLLRRPGGPSSASGSSSQSQSLPPSARDKEEGGLGEGKGIEKAPVVLLRSSVAKRIESGGGKHPEQPQTPSTEIQETKQRPTRSILHLFKPYENMNKRAISIIDKNMGIKPIGSIDFFQQLGKFVTDFFVISIVGKPQTGKSSILSYLADDEEFGNSNIFEKRQRSQELESFMYISPKNVIYIEISSLFNCAASHDLASMQGTLETMSLTWNLRLMRWALSISDLVLIAFDNMFDPIVCQLISSSEMIRPMEPALGENMYPEIVYVCNRVHRSILDDKNVLDKYYTMFESAAGRSARIEPNIFMLPETKYESNSNRFEELKNTIQNFVRYNRATLIAEAANIPKISHKISAYDWYSNAVKLWEEMNQPNYFASYVKLFP